MEMVYLIIVRAFMLLFLLYPIENGGCLRLDIMLAGDYSSSVHPDEKFVIDAFQAFADKFELSENDIKIGVITFEQDAYILCPLTSDKKLLTAKLNTLRGVVAEGGGTNIESSLKKAFVELMGNGRTNVRKFIIVVSDGIDNESEGLENTAEMIKRSGVIICTIMIDDKGNSYLMDKIATPGFFMESSYGNLVNTLKALDLCM